VEGIPAEGEIPLRLIMSDGDRIDVTATVGQPAD
jgi:hypothetical protein